MRLSEEGKELIWCWLGFRFCDSTQPRGDMLGAFSKIILSVLSMQGNISNLFVVLRAGEKLIISLPSFDQHEEDKVDIWSASFLSIP